MTISDAMRNWFVKGGSRLSKAFTGFNELIVSSGYPIIDLKSVYGISDIRDKVAEVGTGTVTNTAGEYVVSTGATAGGTASLSSVEYGRYVAGFEATPGLGVRVPVLPVGDQIARWGYFDDNNGFGFGVDATGFFVFIRKGGTETITYQPDFEFDCGLLDLSFLRIYRMPFRWYGSGPVGFEISDEEDFKEPSIKRIHIIRAQDDEPITEEANLPIRIEVDNGTQDTDLTVYVAGRQFFIQGNYNPSTRITSQSNEAVSVGGTFLPLVSFRFKSGFEGISAKLGGGDLLTASANIRYEVRVGGSLTGASFGAPDNIPATETGLEVDTSATAITGGQKIFEGLANSGAGNRSGQTGEGISDIDLPKDTVITLGAVSLGGTATVSAVFRVQEEW